MLKQNYLNFIVQWFTCFFIEYWMLKIAFNIRVGLVIVLLKDLCIKCAQYYVGFNIVYWNKRIYLSDDYWASIFESGWPGLSGPYKSINLYLECETNYEYYYIHVCHMSSRFYISLLTLFEINSFTFQMITGHPFSVSWASTCLLSWGTLYQNSSKL